MSKDRVEHKIGDVVGLMVDGEYVEFIVKEAPCHDCSFQMCDSNCILVNCTAMARCDGKDVAYVPLLEELKEVDQHE